MRNNTALKLAICATLIASISGCFMTDEKEDKGFVDPFAHSYRIHHNVDFFADFILEASDNPGYKSERIILRDQYSPNNDLFWTLDVVETGHETRTINFSIDWHAGGGCKFTGLSNPAEGELTEGSCVIPTATGHIYFQLEQPTQYRTGNIFGADITLLKGRWMETRNGFLLAGTATLYARQHGGRGSGIGKSSSLPKPAIAKYQDPFKQGNTCIHAGLSNTGTLLDGDPAVCNSALEYTGNGFDLYIDPAARLSFVALDQNNPNDRIPGVVSADGLTISGFSGNVVGVNSHYDLDFKAKTVTLSNRFLWNPTGIPTWCTVSRKGPLTSCR